MDKKYILSAITVPNVCSGELGSILILSSIDSTSLISNFALVFDHINPLDGPILKTLILFKINCLFVASVVSKIFVLNDLLGLK